MQSPSDIVLLQRWRNEQDAHAFRAIAHRYGGLVFGICNRVLKNAADAEEITQECFLKLAQHPEGPTKSLGPWLHSMALRASINRIRSERRRREREATFEAERPEACAPATDDLLSHVDEAIDRLPELQRHCLVGCFLEDRTQDDVAEELGISRRTVKRRTDEAITRVREILGERGITTTAGVLAATLGALTTEAAPPTLSVTLGKIAVAGFEHTSPVAARAVAGKTLQTAGGMLVMKKTVVIGLGGLAILLAGWLYWNTSHFDALGDRNPGPNDGKVAENTGATASALENSLETNSPSPQADEDSQILDSNLKPPPAAHSALLIDVRRYTPKPIADPTKYAAVRGLVVDELGRTIPDASVQLFLFGDDTPSKEAVGRAAMLDYEALRNTLAQDSAYRYESESGSAGTFTFHGVEHTGSGLVAVSAAGFEPRSRNFPIVEGETSDVTVTLRSARAILGIVRTPLGQPVTDALVDGRGVFTENSSSGSGQRPEFLRAKTDIKGEFTLWLNNRDNDEQTYTGLHVKSAEHGEAFFFPIPIGNPERIEITLEPQQTSLTGRILTTERKPATGHRIVLEGTNTLSISGTAFNQQNGPYYSTVTDSEGRYAMGAVATFADYAACIYSPDGQELARQPLPKLEAGKDAVWDYTIDPPVEVTGEVRGVDTGALLPRITIKYAKTEAVFGDPDLGGVVETDGQGAFSVSITAGPGNYRFAPHYQNSVSSGNAGQYARTFHLTADGDNFVSLEIPAPWARRFQLVDQFGSPVAGARASVNHFYGPGGMTASMRDERTDDSGLVAFDQLDPAAEVSFQFYTEGYVPATTSRLSSDGNNHSPPEVVVIYAATDILARLVDETGQAIADSPIQCIAIYGGDRELIVEGATNSDGWLQISGELPATAADLSFRTMPEGRSDSAITHEGRLSGAALQPGAENDLGDILLVLPPASSE